MGQLTLAENAPFRVEMIAASRSRIGEPRHIERSIEPRAEKNGNARRPRGTYGWASADRRLLMQRPAVVPSAAFSVGCFRLPGHHLLVGRATLRARVQMDGDLLGERGL